MENRYQLYIEYFDGSKTTVYRYKDINEARITAYSLIVPRESRVANIDIMDSVTGEVITTYTASKTVKITYDNGEY